MTYQIRLSKSGYDAKTETNPNNFIFHSAYNTFKIVKAGSGSVTVTANSTEDKSISHNYGTRVGFIVFFKHPNNRVACMGGLTDDSSSSSDLAIRNIPPISNSANTITFTVSNSAGTDKTLYYQYYLFEIPV